MTRYIGVYGTFGREDDWPLPTSAFGRFMASQDFAPARFRPFKGFTGDLDGVPLFGSGEDWEAGTEAFIDYCYPIPYEDMNVIGHSHAVQPILMAAAKGLEIRSLILVGSPVRRNLEELAPEALKHIGVCRHLYDPGWDTWGLFGMLFDGRLSLRRSFRVEGMASEAVKGMGHSGVLLKPELFLLWVERGWLDLLRGVPDVEAA